MFKFWATIGYYVLLATVALAAPILCISLFFKKRVEKAVDNFVRRHPYAFITIMILWILLPLITLVATLLGMRF